VVEVDTTGTSPMQRPSVASMRRARPRSCRTNRWLWVLLRGVLQGGEAATQRQSCQVGTLGAAARGTACRAARRARRLRRRAPRGGYRSLSVALPTVDTPGRPVQSDQKPPEKRIQAGEGMRKAEGTQGGRRIDPASPKKEQLRGVLLDLIAAELSFHARSPPGHDMPTAIRRPHPPGAQSDVQPVAHRWSGSRSSSATLSWSAAPAATDCGRDQHHPCTVHLRPLGASP
jgi:hypothetical protein